MQVQGATSVAACHQFDLDSASAYLEQALSQRALTTYEEHLTSCTSCRRHIIELSRLLPAQSSAAEPVVVRASFQARLREWFSGWQLGALAGLGAVAATVLLVAVVVNRSRLDSASPMVAVQQSEAPATLPEPSSLSVPVGEIKHESKPMPSASPAATPPLMDSQGSAKAVPAATPAATTPPQPVEGASSVAAPPPPPPALSKAETERKDVAANQPAAAGGSVAQNQVQNLRIQKPSGPEVNQRQAERALERARKDSESAAQSADSAAPASAKPAPKSPEKPPEKVVEKRSREMEEDANKQQTKARAMKLPSVLMAPVPRNRVVSGKTFRQENGLWIDEAYDASKGLPVVRLTRDSEDYKQTLKDLPSLKLYFDLKSVIVVWQGKVYRVEK